MNSKSKFLIENPLLEKEEEENEKENEKEEEENEAISINTNLIEDYDNNEDKDFITETINFQEPSLNQNKKSSFHSSKYSSKDYKDCFPQEFLLENQIPIYFNGHNKGPSIICLHGAGHSGLSFSLIAKELSSSFRVFAYDSRGHGNNTQNEENDLSKHSQITDFIRVFDYISSRNDFKDDSFIVLGHSMGGSISTFSIDFLMKTSSFLSRKLQGLIVIDVVEGTAMEALPFMENVINSRPKSFETIEKCIEYMYKSNTIQSILSSQYSVPILLKQEKNGEYSWKTDLKKTKSYWKDWFEGLTSVFLSIKIPKLLVLAGSERMDKDLTIAHMQGRFRMIVVNDVGHIIHEDNHKKMSEIVKDFVKVFRIPSCLSEIREIVGKIGKG